MRKQWIIVLVFASLVSMAQKTEWQHGVIIGVEKQPDSQVADSQLSTYDISVRVGSTVYLVSYVVPKNSSMVEYRVGADLVVLVGETTLTFNDLQGNPHTVKILRKETAAPAGKQ
jgi:hypothetical protein